MTFAKSATFRRIAVTAFALAFLLLSFWSGFDRMAVRTPAMARFVVDPLAAQSAHVRTASLLVERAYTQAVEASRLALARTPAESRGAANFALASLLAGDLAAADRALEVARMGGRRDPVMLSSSAALALDRGSYDEAAAHIEALLRGAPRFPGVEDLSAALLASEGGRRAMLGRMQNHGVWASDFLAGGGDGGLEDRAGLLMQSDVQPLGCEFVAPVVERMLKAGARLQAERSWAAHCPRSAAVGLIADPEFASLFEGEALNPFGWNRERSGDVSMSRERLKDGSALEVSNSATVSRLILSQPVDLSPGRYRLDLDADVAGQERIVMQLQCGDESSLAALRAEARLLDVPQACVAQSFEVWLKPGTGPVRLKSIRLVRD